MISSTEIGRVFAHARSAEPHVRRRLAESIERAHVSAELLRFLDRYSSTSLHMGSLTDHIGEGLLAHMAEFEFGWAPSFISTCKLNRQGEADATNAAADLAMLTSSIGVAGEWRAAFSQPRRLRWEGFVLPAALEVTVGASAAEAHFVVITPERETLKIGCRKSSAGWEITGPAIPVMRVGRHMHVHSPASGRAECALPPDVERKGITPDSRARVALEAALTIAARASESHGDWIELPIRELLLLQVEEGRMRSGSDAGWPGVVYMSLASPTVMAENLVHEASHQFLHVLERLEPVDDGSDGQLYFSPVTGRMRPVGAVLSAYHAFTNVYLFLGACLEAGVGDPHYCVARRRSVLPQLAELFRPLDGNAAVTAAGRTLLEELSRQTVGVS